MMTRYHRFLALILLAFALIQSFAENLVLDDIFSFNKHHLIEYNTSQRFCSTVSCTKVHITFDKFSESILQSILEFASRGNETVRIFHISFHIAPAISVVPLIGSLVDDFLTTRPWWTVLQEPFVWHAKHSKDIVLERVSYEYEAYLRRISSMQYPESHICDKTVMFTSFSGCTHPGWANALTTFYNNRLTMPFHISTTYVSGVAGWMSPTECDKADKWECAFLPMTNCTKPEVLTSYDVAGHTEQEFNKMFEGKQLFDAANAKGKQFDNEKNKYGPQYTNTSRTELQQALSSHVVSNYVTNLRLPVEAQKSVYDYHFILRNNHRFRSLIAEQKHNFLHKNGLTLHTRCVAAHVRRGERVGSFHGNWTEVCYNATRKITDTHKENLCQDKSDSGKLGSCYEYTSEKGCERVLPFGAITVEMLIQSAEKMVSNEVRNLFLFTDDEAWALKEIERARKVYPKWTVNLFEAPKPPPTPQNHSTTPSSSTGTGILTKYDAKVKSMTANMDSGLYPGYSFTRFFGGAAAGAFFLGSLQLAQQCEAFTGHFSSAVPLLFLESMCLRHNNGRYHGVCPPYFDVSLGSRMDV